MLDTNRYPKLNDPTHERPVLSVQHSWLVWLWVAAPVVVIALAYLLR
jgi:hypothetical protein